MTCVIEKLEISNFMCFEYAEIDFLKMPGITSIMGINNDIPGASNGTGKSTGPLALFYCLYGKAGVKINNKSLVNKYTNKKNFDVTVFLSIDNIKFKICRGADNSNNSFLSLYKFDNDDFIDITSASIAETDARIIQLLNGLTADLFLKTVYLTLSYGDNFFQMSRNAKTEFLNLISGTSKLYDINSVISKDISECNTQIRIIDSELLALNKNNEEYIAKKDEFLNSQQRILQQYNEEAQELKQQIIEYKKNLAQSQLNTDKLSNDISVFKQLCLKIKQKKQNSELNLSKLQTAKKAILLKNKHVDDVFSKNKTLVECLCDICLPKATNILHMPTLQKEKDNNQITLTQIEKAVAQTTNEITQLTEQISKDDKKANEILQEYQHVLTEHNKQIRLLEHAETKLNLLEQKYKNSTIDEPFSALINKSETLIKNKHLEKTNIITNRQQLSILQFATDNETVHKFVTSQFVQDVNFYIAKYLNLMGVNYYCKFDNDLTYSFITPAGEMMYDNFSSGEKHRLAVAISFALRQLLMNYLNINVNVLILDEYLDSNLDDLAIDGIINMLTEIKENKFYNLFLISHRKEFLLSSSIDNNLIVSKTNGISEYALAGLS